MLRFILCVIFSAHVCTAWGASELFVDQMPSSKGAPSNCQPVDELAPSVAAQENIQNARTYLEKFIAENPPRIKNYALHFFWATGKQALYEDAADSSVLIGGRAYGHRFLNYVNAFLLHTPAAVKVHFTCDDATFNANFGALEVMAGLHPHRFSIHSIEEALEKTCTGYAYYTHGSDTNAHLCTLNDVFQNALTGNPVIASDVYRLISMPFMAVESAEDVEEHYKKNMFAYCDIDTFCFGMESNTVFPFHEDRRPGYARLLSALFQAPVIPKTSSLLPINFPIYHAMHPGTNNDVITILGTDILQFQWFMHRILQEITAPENPCANPRLIHHFLTLHHTIENFTARAFHTLIMAPYLQEMQIMSVVSTTGPGLLEHLYLTSPLQVSYPDVFAMSWHDVKLLEGGVMHPLQCLGAGSHVRGALTGLSLTVGHIFTRYKNLLGMALYAKDFGEHPFNVAIQEVLKQQFPYHTQTFKRYVKKRFEQECKYKIIQAPDALGCYGEPLSIGCEAYSAEKKGNVYKSMTIEAWFNSLYNWIRFEGDRQHVNDFDDALSYKAPYFQKLMHLLEKVDVRIDFSSKDLDFRPGAQGALDVA